MKIYFENVMQASGKGRQNNAHRGTQPVMKVCNEFRGGPSFSVNSCCTQLL